MATERVVIVGASHGGHQAILELLSRYDNVDITLFEAGEFISFMSCGMELYLEDAVTDVEDVRNFSPADFPQKNVHILAKHEVTKINADNKTVTVVDLQNNTIIEQAYDKLILSSGVTPKSLPVPGADLENVYLMRGKDWATKIKAKLSDPNVNNITIVGSGYIGIEAAEASRKAGKKVTLIDVIDRPLGTYLDSEFTDIVTKKLTDEGINIQMGAHITAYIGDKAVQAVQTTTDSFLSDVVIQAAGVQPNTDWLKGTVDLDNRGWIKTDEYLRTNLPDVYAIGDATLAYSIPAQMKMPIALATVARREARYIVKHLFEKRPSVPFKGLVGSSALSLFDIHFAQSGLNSFTAKRANVMIAKDTFKTTLRPKYVPIGKDNPDVWVQLFFNPTTHVLLGGATLSTYDVTPQGNVIALAIQQGLRLEDLAEADFFFQPGFDRQWSVLNLAAQHALGEEKFTE